MKDSKKLTTAKKLSGMTELDKALALLDKSADRLWNRWMLKKISSWLDVATLLGLEDRSDITTKTEPLTIEQIKLLLKQLEEQIRKKYDNKGETSTGERQRAIEESIEKFGYIRQAPRESLYIPQAIKPYPNGTHLFKQQEDAAEEALNKLFRDNLPSYLLRAGVGSGKTFVCGAVLVRLIEAGLLDKCYPANQPPWPVVYVTKASIVEQTKRVIRDRFGLDVINQVVVTNYDALRAKFGDLFIKWETIITNGEATVKPIWRPRLHPLLFIWDECQALKNEDSLQSQIGQAVNDIWHLHGVDIKQLFLSATPFMRVSDAKVFACSTRISYSWGMKKDRPLDNLSWKDFAHDIAAPSEPEEYNEAAVERLVKALDQYIGGISNLRPQFYARNGIKVIDFETPEERKEYEDAWEAYLVKKAEIERMNERL